MEDLIHVLVHLLFDPTNRKLTRHSNGFGMVMVEPSEIFVANPAHRRHCSIESFSPSANCDSEKYH